MIRLIARLRELEEQQHMAKTLDKSRDRLTKKLRAEKAKAKGKGKK